MKITNEEKKYQLERIKNLLIVVDMVNGFVTEGPLAAPSIMGVVPTQEELIKEYLADASSAVAFIRDCHTDNSVEFNTFGAHCIKGTPETEVIEPLHKYVKDSLVFLKNSTNFVFSKEESTNEPFISLLSSMNKLETASLVGCLSEVCVKNGGITLKNLLDEQNRDVSVCVYEDAIDTYSCPGHISKEVTERSLSDMESNGIKRIKKM